MTRGKTCITKVTFGIIGADVVMCKFLTLITISFALLGTSIYAGGAEEEKLMNTNSCVGCDLSNAWLEKADLKKADFSGANLYRANLEYADLRGANFTGADLSNVRLRGANLTNAILDNAILRYTNLGEANLSGASLKGTKLKDARFYNTKTDGIRF